MDEPDKSVPSNDQVGQENILNNASIPSCSHGRRILGGRNDANLPRRPRGRPPKGAMAMSNAERMRAYRKRRRESIVVGLESRVPIQPTSTHSRYRDTRITDNWSSATAYIQKAFFDNEFGSACNVCDRLWFKNDLVKVKESHLITLEPEFGISSRLFMLCRNCSCSLDRCRLPPNSITNGFKYPDVPEGLPPLNAVSARLISPRIPFMAIRRLRRDGSYGIIGQVINIPMDVNTMVRSLPRQLDDDYSFNVSIKRKLIHKSSYLSGFVQKSVIRQWLTFLVQQPLYRHYKITIDPDFLNNENFFDKRDFCAAVNDDLVENLDNNDTINEELMARQQTLLWCEENTLEIAPDRGTRQLNLIFDEYAEELSFPQIYYGVGRFFKLGIRVTPYMIANSEIRRKDRRGATPNHILYDAMKIMRIRVVDCIHNSFRCVKETENLTRRMIEDHQFLQDCVEKNFAFLKSIPNSVNYWQIRKKDLFAMMRQLGKPTAFLTLSANEINWPGLLNVLFKLRNNGKTLNEHNIAGLDRSVRADLVNEDPVTCCLYFHKLVDTLMNMLKSSKSHNPFGRYRVKDFFLRIEFQHRGSPHAHILLWLENDPREPVSEYMPQTIQLISDICSVHQSDLPVEMYSNQVHHHTFTCTKRGETTCRFNIPYWPMRISRVLLPLADNHIDRALLRSKAKQVRDLLASKCYDTIDTFLDDNRLDEHTYLNVIRSTLNRPTVCFRREMSQIMTNTFHPWIGQIMNSNMDIQFILEEYSCASYVVDYVNKSNRGLSHLHRELVKLAETHPEMTQVQLLRKLGAKVLNTVEMSAQEAAWYLLRLPMSQCSRDVAYISTCWPCERSKAHKTRSQLDRANINPDSTDIWAKSIIQHYEERPSELTSICLADFVAWYGTKSRSSAASNAEIDIDDDDHQPAIAQRRSYNRREFSRIIRFRHYDTNDANNLKREMVTLYVPFRSELVEILDRNKFISIYDSQIEHIAAKKKEYESGLNIIHVLEELRQVGTGQNDEPTVDVVMERDEFVQGILNEGDEENFDDLTNRLSSNVVAAVTTRPNVITKDEYCGLMRTTNERQREFILEFIHRLSTTQSRPIQVFFTGPAGCGKTFVLKLIMETLNRYSQTGNHLNNSYVACASTGKAAVGLGGTTVHSAFHITQSRRQAPIARETLHSFRQLFKHVGCVIIDEVSMIGSDVLHKINQRLQQITGELDHTFGCMNMIFCGDFRQLPPVNASPVYKGSRNHLEGALLWQSLDFFALDQVMRQSDTAFVTILTKIGDGRPLSANESSIIENRFVSQLYADQNLQGITRLYHQNYMVHAHNTKAIIGGTEFMARDLIVGYSTNEMLVAARTKLHRMAVMETAGLPYCLLLSQGSPYMLTSNIAIDDGLVNGAMGILKFIENFRDLGGEVDSSKMRLWLEFPDTKTGSLARLRFRSTATHSETIMENWTPVLMKTASIVLTDSVRCKRTQFPLTPAHAITIHKSQGGTFDKVVILYDKSQQNQLVYVALSRVKSINGLYLINLKDDFTFYHKHGSTASSIKEIGDEYTRLDTHQLETITRSVSSFLQIEDRQSTAIICTINAQSLVAHSQDIATDRVICRSDIMVITETWMDPSSPVDIHGYELISSSYSYAAHPHNISRDIQAPHVRRFAGGVAIYRKLGLFTSCSPICHNITEPISFECSSVGDISLAEIAFNGREKIVLCAIYIHPKASKTSIESFLLQALANYTDSTLMTCPAADIDIKTPMIVTGDFNSNVQDSNWLKDFMRDEFGLSYVICHSPTTLRNTIIDLTFVRSLSAHCMPFVAYFSDHRPLFTRLVLDSPL